MAELSTLARPYAKAAFEYAVANDKLAAWGNMFAELSAISLDEKVQALLTAPAMSAEVIGTQFTEVCGDIIDDNAKNLILALAENKRIALLPFINDQFQLLKAAKDQQVDVLIETAFALQDEELARFKQALASSLAREVVIETQVNEQLIGGAVIRAGDTVIDGSIRSKLSTLSDALSH